MKLLIDENVSYYVVEYLLARGWEVIAALDLKNAPLTDKAIYQLALREKAIIITRDYHFTNPIRFPTKNTQGIIYLRHGNLTALEELEIVEKFLQTDLVDKMPGKLVTLYRDSTSIR